MPLSFSSTSEWKYLAFQQVQSLAWLRKLHDHGVQSGWDQIFVVGKPSDTHSPNFWMDFPFL